ncbi:MAG: spore germination protein, partial [Clostridia bacterium]
DGIPSAIIAPTNLTYLLNAAEDANTPTIFVLMTRLYRILGLIIAIYLPGFWIALLTYHQDQIPLTLLSTLVLSRQGVPLPTPLEGIFMLMLFELLKEAGLRLPTAIGQTLSVVGGLIIGQAAISAGMTAPGVLVIMAIAIVATFTLGNQNLVSLVSLLRMGVLIVCAFLGMFGFLISLMGITMALANLRSFGIPYLAPISPPVWRDLFKVLFSLPWRRIDSPPNMIDKKGGSK